MKFVGRKATIIFLFTLVSLIIFLQIITMFGIKNIAKHNKNHVITMKNNEQVLNNVQKKEKDIVSNQADRLKTQNLCQRNGVIEDAAGDVSQTSSDTTNGSLNPIRLNNDCAKNTNVDIIFNNCEGKRKCTQPSLLFKDEVLNIKNSDREKTDNFQCMRTQENSSSQEERVKTDFNDNSNGPIKDDLHSLKHLNDLKKRFVPNTTYFCNFYDLKLISESDFCISLKGFEVERYDENLLDKYITGFFEGEGVLKNILKSFLIAVKDRNNFNSLNDANYTIIRKISMFFIDIYLYKWNPERQLNDQVETNQEKNCSVKNNQKITNEDQQEGVDIKKESSNAIETTDKEYIATIGEETRIIYENSNLIIEMKKSCDSRFEDIYNYLANNFSEIHTIEKYHFDLVNTLLNVFSLWYLIVENDSARKKEKDKLMQVYSSILNLIMSSSHSVMTETNLGNEINTKYY